jgi:hypothetical protein
MMGYLTTLGLLLFKPSLGWAQARSSHSLGFQLALTGPSQDDVNSWVNSLNQVGTKEMGAGYEFLFDYQYRFQRTMFAVLFRPSYLIQDASGGGVKTSLRSFQLFPMFRLYPLENSFIQFFMQVGVGYGSADLKLENAGASGNYSGSAFGALAGLGVNFCFTPSHCVSVEGNLRYLPMPRITGSASGALGGNITQVNGELEQNNRDLGITLSGVQGLVGYRLNF